MRRLASLTERSGTARRSVRMREIAPEHGRSLGIRANATTGEWSAEQGREFDVRFHGVHFDIPEFAAERLGQRGVEAELQTIVDSHLEAFIEELKGKYKWIGAVGLAGRGPGWLVVGDKSFGEESTEDGWDDIHEMVELAMGALVADINDPKTWEDVVSSREESRGLGERREPLKTEINTAAMGHRVLTAFKTSDYYDKNEKSFPQVDFEHGQWWVTIPGTGAQYSVLDAGGDEFDFEMVSRPEEAVGERAGDVPTYWADDAKEAQAAVAFLKNNGVASARVGNTVQTVDGAKVDTPTVFVSREDDPEAEGLLTGWEGVGVDERAARGGTLPLGVVTLKDGRKGHLVGHGQDGPRRYLIIKTDDGDEVEVDPKDAKADLWLPTEGVQERASARAVTPTERIAKFREIVQDKQYAKIDGATVDLFTASAVVQVYDKLNPANQEKFASFPAPKMASVAWKLLKEVRVEDNMVGFDQALEDADLREKSSAAIDQGVVAQYKKEREEIERNYRVQDGRIRSPGKFEGEMIYVPYLWNHGLEGLADEDDGETFIFRITPEEKAAFPELAKTTVVRLRERDDGFVVEV